MAYLMGIDMGTTSVKTAVFDEALQEKMKLTADYTLDSKGDTVEFPAEQYWEIVKGEIAKVTETIDNENASGAVYADGKTWTARSVDDAVIPAGSRVQVEAMQGVKLLVKPVEK